MRPDLKDAVADKGKVKLRNVLTMTTGLHYDFNPPNDPIYYEAPDRLKLAATTTPLLEPGRCSSTWTSIRSSPPQC